MEVDLSLTGDPFIDSGGMVLEEYQRLFPRATNLELIEKVAEIYITQWNKKLNPLFLNSPITNPSVKENLNKTLEYYHVELKQASEIQGYCKTCGAEGNLFAAGRDIFPLVGSGKFLNFHHSFEAGSYLCGSCLYKLFFMPLGVVYLGGLVGLLQINSPEVKKLWKEKTLSQHQGHLATGSSQGILKSPYNKPVNALFYFARDLIEEIQDNAGDESQMLTLFHFSNFGASPDCAIYALNHKVFQFLFKVLAPHLKKDWNRFINLHYSLPKGQKADARTGQILKNVDGEEVEQAVEEYQNSYNAVYHKLFNGKRIVYLFRQRQQKDWKDGRLFPPIYAFHYGKEILQMTQDQFETIKKLVQGIFQLYENSPQDLEKPLKTMLYEIKSKSALRNFILRLCGRNYKGDNPHPLITLEEINFHLLGSQLYWGEVRDYLVIYFYELLHERKIELSQEGFEQEPTESEALENI